VVFLLDVDNTPLDDDFGLLQISAFCWTTRSRSDERDDRSAAAAGVHDRAYWRFVPTQSGLVFRRHIRCRHE